MSDLRLRDVTEADLAAVLRIRSRSFGPLGPGGEEWWRRVAAEVVPGRMLAVVDGSGTMLAAGRARPFEQVWGGRHLAMGGVAGVYVEPSARGRGVGSLLMRGLITRMVELGDPVSCLYPTVPELYRGVGYEVGGVQPRRSYAAHDVRAIRSLGGGLRPRPAGPADAELVHALDREHQARHGMSGPMVPSVDAWRHHLGSDGAINYVLDGTDGVARGFVTYSLADEVLTVEALVGETVQATATLWGVVGSGSSAAPTVRTYLDPRHPGSLLLPSAPALDVSEHTWMLRVIDLAKAVAARGFSPHVSATAQVIVEDPDAPVNSGHWRIDVAGGTGTAQQLQAGPDSREAHSRPEPFIDSAARATPSPIESAARAGASPAAYDNDGEPARLGPRGLAALWSGWTMSRLRTAGLAHGGDPDADAALDAIFACQPFMTEYF